MQTIEEIKAIAEAHGACQPGAHWGAVHTLDEIPTRLRASWALWVLEHIGALLEDPTPFILAAQRNPKAAAYLITRGITNEPE